MERQEKSQAPQVQEAGSLFRKAPGNDGIERVRKARERYTRRQSRPGLTEKPYLLPCMLLCLGIGFLVSVKGIGTAVAAPEDALLVEAFPQSPGENPEAGPLGEEAPQPGGPSPSGEALQPGGPPPSGQASQLAGPPQASAAIQTSGVGQAPRGDKAQDSTGPTETLVAAEKSYQSLGTFEITGYCSCDACCGVKAAKLTKSETVPRASHTVAADLEVLPMGTRIMIDGVIYQVEDTGKAIRGRVVDIFFDTHQEALEFGRQEKTVYLVK